MCARDDVDIDKLIKVAIIDMQQVMNFAWCQQYLDGQDSSSNQEQKVKLLQKVYCGDKKK